MAFAVAVLKMRLYNWQAFILDDVASGAPTTGVTPNGSGKTSIIIAALALWCLHEWPGATVVLTSASYRQVRDQVFGALQQHEGKFPGWKWKDAGVETPQGGRIVGFATDSGGRFEGFHAYPDRPLLIIFDEAKSIDDGIYEAADRCNPTMQLYVSSAGGLFGRFADSFKSARFKKHEITITDCPHITPEFIAAMREQYGADSDIYRSMILGKFARGFEDGKVIPFAAYENALRAPPMFSEGTKQVFCDFAESHDENVIAKRNGNRLDFVDCWVGDGNTSAITMRFADRLRPLKEAGYTLYGDADGTGHGYITALGQMGITIHGVKNNGTPKDAHYYNTAAEQWWALRRGLEKCEWILPRDEALKRQLCSRDQVFREVDGKKVFGRDDGVLQLMPKSKLSTQSPDRADAIVGAAYDYPSLTPQSWLKEATPFERYEEGERSGPTELAGMNAGN